MLKEVNAKVGGLGRAAGNGSPAFVMISAGPLTGQESNRWILGNGRSRGDDSEDARGSLR